jgi:hypothetical protein
MCDSQRDGVPGVGVSPQSGALRCRNLVPGSTVPRLGLATWRGVRLKLREPHKCVFPRGAAHVRGWRKAGAEGRALRAAENLAAIFLRELDAPHPRRFPAGHPWNGACDGGRDAARTAVRAALHVTKP